ncbi:uncharacterized protein LOC142609014 [Castanea sativa]|uniref:uncharacterized protein LOC142609014 n=1 Tax=Castanea sativa TaxID=21020 RepID=UPI003F65190E
MPRTAIKGQVLADFVAEFTKDNLKKEEAVLTVTFTLPISAPLWEVYTDGASNRKGAGIRIVLITPKRLIMEKSLRLGFAATNNEAEYAALLVGALMVSQLGGEVVELYCDSHLVLGQINGEFEARNERMQGYLNRVKCACNKFKSFVVKQILEDRMLTLIHWLCLPHPSGVEASAGILPEDKIKVEKVRRNAPRYWLSEEQRLYKRSYSAFRRYCGDLKIRNGYSTPAYPQGNGQAEATNKVILARLKKRLDDAKGKWVEELPHVFWTYRTTPCRSTSETPFSMTYGMEVVIPLESRFPTLKSEQYNVEGNHHMLLNNLDTIEERREVASVKMANYQQKLIQTYDKGVKLRPLMPGNLVLRRVVGIAKNLAWGKLGPNWEGPYKSRL